MKHIKFINHCITFVILVTIFSFSHANAFVDLYEKELYKYDGKILREYDNDFLPDYCEGEYKKFDSLCRKLFYADSQHIFKDIHLLFVRQAQKWFARQHDIRYIPTTRYSPDIKQYIIHTNTYVLSLKEYIKEIAKTSVENFINKYLYKKTKFFCGSIKEFSAIKDQYACDKPIIILYSEGNTTFEYRFDPTEASIYKLKLQTPNFDCEHEFLRHYFSAGKNSKILLLHCEDKILHIKKLIKHLDATLNSDSKYLPNTLAKNIRNALDDILAVWRYRILILNNSL
jgi:hypothetical protein